MEAEIDPGRLAPPPHRLPVLAQAFGKAREKIGEKQKEEEVEKHTQKAGGKQQQNHQHSPVLASPAFLLCSSVN